MSNEINLLEELAQATAPKPEPGINTELDFTPPAPDQNTMETSDDDFAPPPPAPEPEPEQAMTEVMYKPEELADLIIDGASSLMEIGLPMAFESSLSKEDRKSLKSLALKYRKHKKDSSLNLDEEDQRVMEIYIDLEEYKEMCPLDDDDKKTLRGPLIEVLKKTHYQTTPENALMISAGIIMLPRLLPIVKNKL